MEGKNGQGNREEAKTRREELQNALRERAREVEARTKEANEVISSGRGVLKLEKPLMLGEEEVTELAYDFMQLSGLDYTAAMDSAGGTQQGTRITHRQALALFAKAAEKKTERLDMRDIVEQLGVTDAMEGVQLATLFFIASARGGHLRISKLP